MLLQVYLQGTGEHHAVITQLGYNLRVLSIWISIAWFSSGYKVQMNKAIFLPKYKTVHSEHAEVALYRSFLLTYPYLLCDIKMRLLLLEFLLPGCEVLWCHCSALQRCRELNPSLLAQRLMLHRGAKERLWFHGGLGLGFFLKLVSMGELHGMWHVGEEATVIALDLPLCSGGVAAKPCVSQCVWGHAHDTFLKGGDWRGAGPHLLAAAGP